MGRAMGGGEALACLLSYDTCVVRICPAAFFSESFPRLREPAAKIFTHLRPSSTSSSSSLVGWRAPPIEATELLIVNEFEGAMLAREEIGNEIESK